MTGEALSWFELARKRLPWRRWERGIKRLSLFSCEEEIACVTGDKKSCSGSSTSAVGKRRRWMMWCGKEGSLYQVRSDSARGRVTVAARTCLELTPAQRSVSALWEQHPTTVRWGEHTLPRSCQGSNRVLLTTTVKKNCPTVDKK